MKDKKARKEVKFKQPEEKGIRQKLFRKLYANQGEGLYILVTYFPFFSASWIAGGLVLDQLQPFIVATLVIVISNYGKMVLFDRVILFKKEFGLILGGLFVALFFVYYSLTGLVAATLLLALSTIMSFLEIQINNSSPFSIILKSISLITRMGIYSLVGILTQRFVTHPSLVFEHAVFGFVPGCILAGSLISRYSQVFFNNAWKRQIIVKNKKGAEITRPGSLSRMIAIYTVAGPALPLLLTPFDIFPTPFLATALIFTLIIKNLEAYLKAIKPDAVLALEQANIALLMSFLLLAIGILIRAGIT